MRSLPPDYKEGCGGLVSTEMGGSEATFDTSSQTVLGRERYRMFSINVQSKEIKDKRVSGNGERLKYWSSSIREWINYFPTEIFVPSLFFGQELVFMGIWDNFSLVMLNSLYKSATFKIIYWSTHDCLISIFLWDFTSTAAALDGWNPVCHNSDAQHRQWFSERFNMQPGEQGKKSSLP